MIGGLVRWCWRSVPEETVLRASDYVSSLLALALRAIASDRFFTTRGAKLPSFRKVCSTMARKSAIFRDGPAKTGSMQSPCPGPVLTPAEAHATIIVPSTSTGGEPLRALLGIS